MRREAKKRLYDVGQAAELIARFTAGKTFKDYLNDPMLRAATERKFEIIGEALAQLAKHDPPTAARVREPPPHHRFSQHSHSRLCRCGRPARLGYC
ncbi:MAG: DUF86 domain-containing protein [Hyphomicrobiales bacterium]|nr:DUF86 domain-containing protein [Hyphomicrobiales bacterium]